MGAGTQAIDGIARWLGVKGDEEELQYRQQQYNYTKAAGNTMTAHRPHRITEQHLKMLELAETDDHLDENEFNPDKQGTPDAPSHAAIHPPHQMSSESMHSAEHATTRDPAEGLEHYRWLHDEELDKISKPGWFGGEVQCQTLRTAPGG